MFCRDDKVAGVALPRREKGRGLHNLVRRKKRALLTTTREDTKKDAAFRESLPRLLLPPRS
jgi:hypothetical protein